MKQLTTNTGVYGPFSDVIELEDRWSCDGVDYPFSVVGTGTVDESTIQPIVDIAYLEAIKESKNKEINAARLAANQGTFLYGGSSISCDQLSRGDIDAINGFISLTGSLPPGWPGGWKAVDNTIIPIPDVQTWIGFYGAMIYSGNLNFAHSQMLKAALQQAENIGEVEAIQWNI